MKTLYEPQTHFGKIGSPDALTAQIIRKAAPAGQERIDAVPDVWYNAPVLKKGFLLCVERRTVNSCRTGYDYPPVRLP